MTKIKMISITIALLFINACESKSSDINIMIEMRDDPLDGMTVSESMRKSMGAEGLIVEYKKCMSNMSQGWLETLKERAKEDLEVKSAKKVASCPVPFDALCESKSRQIYYYSDAKRILDGAKEECVYLGKWTANTQGKEVVAKMYKATFHVNGTPYTYESVNNCSINPINKDIVSTPQLSNDNTWVKLSVNTKKETQGCMLDFNLNSKHYHVEKCKANYDGKKLTGSTTAKNIHKHDDSVEITFDIVCE